MLEREQQAAALSVALIDLTLVYRESLAQAKKEKNILDFPTRSMRHYPF